MQILTAGKSYPTKKLALHFAQNKENIVFAPFEGEGVVDISANLKTDEDIAEFIKANEIKLVVVPDRNYIAKDWYEILIDTDTRIFCPDYDSKKITQSISSGKKFAYKNKLQTSKFAVFDKLPAINEYIGTSNYPIIIIPDTPNDKEGAFIAETKRQAREQIEKLSSTGNKKILIEDYVSPVEYTKYLITDATGVMGLFGSVSYFGDLSTNNINGLDKEILEKIETEFIPQIIDGLIEDGIYYKGILGITFNLDNRGNVWFSRFKPFFDENEIDIALNVINENLEDLFYFAAKDDMLNEYEKLDLNDNFVIVQNAEKEIITGSAKTFNKAIDRLIIEGGDINLVDEAKKFWGLGS